MLSRRENDAEDDFLKKEMIVERCILTLGEQDSEVQIREKVASSLKDKYSIIGPNDFEFVKVTQKRINVLHLSKGTEYSYDVVEKLVGQGLLYIRMNRDHNSDSDSELLQVGLLEPKTLTPLTAALA